MMEKNMYRTININVSERVAMQQQEQKNARAMKKNILKNHYFICCCNILQKYFTKERTFLLTNVGENSILRTVNEKHLWRGKSKREPGESISRINTASPLKSSSISLYKADYSVDAE